MEGCGENFTGEGAVSVSNSEDTLDAVCFHPFSSLILLIIEKYSSFGTRLNLHSMKGLFSIFIIESNLE